MTYDRVGGSALKRFATVSRSVLLDPGQLRSEHRQGFCPVCGRLRTFYTSGDPPRRRVLCGGCLSLERHRLLWLVVDRVLEERGRDLRVLHFAPESFMSYKLRDVAHYVGIDIRPGVEGVVGDAERLPFESGSFDVVVSSHVLEHVPDDRRALSEVTRVLREGGEAILAVPVAWGYRETYENPDFRDRAARTLHFGQSDHVRFYGVDFEDRVRASGLEVERVMLGPEKEVELGLGRGESVYRAHK